VCAAICETPYRQIRLGARALQRRTHKWLNFWKLCCGINQEKNCADAQNLLLIFFRCVYLINVWAERVDLMIRTNCFIRYPDIFSITATGDITMAAKKKAKKKAPKRKAKKKVAKKKAKKKAPKRKVKAKAKRKK
jgi:hypothetical protein